MISMQADKLILARQEPTYWDAYLELCFTTANSPTKSEEWGPLLLPPLFLWGRCIHKPSNPSLALARPGTGRQASSQTVWIVWIFLEKWKNTLKFCYAVINKLKVEVSVWSLLGEEGGGAEDGDGEIYLILFM